ncbi:rRNA maturation RNase YbeY [Sphaerochaeta sp. PS]|uniref:rRNA maturation RNase YbeY n=1 Tax=Sphaerochaeta sp. PS TaxID=3076336 RepID=UPI0028A52CF5|nr:rRNA maturation RNase YbeY [Sphaerochaeta sp. PS]MDT4761534.1 rRNA maturation RNase YbeY [Sphaerochaeta sp. PS]
MKNSWIIDISYGHESFREEAPEELVQQRVSSILETLGVEPCELSVSFVSDDEIQELNKTYRDRDETTDILSFVQDDEVEDFSWPELVYEDDAQPAEIRVLGDMVLSLDTLKRNAQSFSVETDEELFRLLIHGVLHLLGFDHATNDESEPMLVQQEQLLVKLGGSKR